jgi:GNAT superfamily N-acetyltransferase
MADLPELSTLMAESIRVLIGACLDPARVAASHEIMGIDTQLIEDGTYFVVECERRIAGCGGWSRRGTLFGGDHSGSRDARLLSPSTEPARVRAMYTHPDFARRGVGRLVLSLSEAAAAREGFRTLELVATVAGEPLYLACGFSIVERIEVPTSTVTVPCARMARPIVAAEPCPSCGALLGGRSGCQALFDRLSAEAWTSPLQAGVHNLVVDTYAMQHPEEYCRSAKSYAAHLTALCCGVECSGNQTLYWAIPRWLDGPATPEKPPLIKCQSRMTIADVRDPGAKYPELVRLWALNVWEAYSAQHALARHWLDTVRAHMARTTGRVER